MIQPQGASVRNISIKGSLKELNGRFPYSFTYPNLWNPYPFVYLSMPIVLVPLLSVFFLQVVLVTLDAVVHFLDFVLFLDVALFFIVFFLVLALFVVLIVFYLQCTCSCLYLFLQMFLFFCFFLFFLPNSSCCCPCYFFYLPLLFFLWSNTTNRNVWISVWCLCHWFIFDSIFIF